MTESTALGYDFVWVHKIMSIILSETLDKAIAFLKGHLRKNKFFVKIGENEITKFSGSKRGNKVYALRTAIKIDPIIKSLAKSENAKFLTLTHTYDYKNPVESWTYMKKEIPKFVRKCKFNAYLYVYEAHKNGGCHCHLIVTGSIDNQKIKQLWNGHIKIKKIISSKIGAYLTKEIGKAGHVESALRNWDDKKQLRDNDIKKIWRFYYLLKLKMRGWNCSRNLRTSDSSDLITNMNNSTGDKLREKEIVLSLPRKIVKDRRFRPYCERLKENQSDWKLIIGYLSSLKILKIPMFPRLSL